jgi:hypothetical protein
MATTPFLEIGPACQDAQRRADILAHPLLNGIDYVEVSADQRTIKVFFIKPLPDPPNSDPDGAYGLTTHPEWVQIYGGARVVDIHVIGVHLVADHLEITVDAAGDFSIYLLTLGLQFQEDGSAVQNIPNLDIQFSRIALNFKAGCPAEVDCKAEEICTLPAPPEPLIDYLAKDYASFRQLLLDTVPQLNPKWVEQSPADLGIALVELLAYAGDQLSYFQDAVSNEAYLDTVRKRISAKRHARLVDYVMHDGRNAWTYVYFQVTNPYALPQQSQILSRVTAPLRGKYAPPGPVILAGDLTADSFESDPALTGTRVFETAFPVQLDPNNNVIFLHDWGNQECCLPRGATSAYLYYVDGAGLADYPPLQAGDFLLLEEVLGPATGAAADANPQHRQVVRLATVQKTSDPVYSNTLQGGRPQPWQLGDPQLKLLRVTWAQADELQFPLCLSARPPGKDPLFNVTVARGNIVLADDGRTLSETLPPPDPAWSAKTLRVPLTKGPLTFQMQPAQVDYDTTGHLTTPRTNLSGDVREAQPAIALLIDFPTGQELWEAVPHLLESPPFAQEFVADVDDNGNAILRFGDDEYGRAPHDATAFTPVYRVGNGAAGNVGGESLSHVVQAAAAPIALLRNPLPARDGADPETIEQVREYAPAAFHAEQFRAVTEADYTQAAEKMPELQSAVAAFRWTGSWYTVFVAVAPRNPADVITQAGGRTRITPSLQQKVLDFLTRYKLAGYDLEVRSAEYVPLALSLDLCVSAEYFRTDVAQAVREALSNQINADETLGFFHPSNFNFGQDVYLSRIYAAVEKVEGVDSLVITEFHRFGKPENGELQSGVLPIGPWEIARLDNDPNFAENGTLKMNVMGGK